MHVVQVAVKNMFVLEWTQNAHIVGFGTEPKSTLEPPKDTLPVGRSSENLCLYVQLTSHGRVRYESMLYMQPTCHVAIASQECYSRHYPHGEVTTHIFVG